MAHVSTQFPLTFDAAPLTSFASQLAASGAAITLRYRQWRTYRRTLQQLQGYTQRNLEDLGATRGIDDFARRAAGL